MFLRNDARRTQRNVRTDQRVFGLWSVAQTTAAVSDGGPVTVGGVGQLLLLSSCFYVGQLLLQTVASFCFNGDQLLLLAGTHGGPTASPRGLP